MKALIGGIFGVVLGSFALLAAAAESITLQDAGIAGLLSTGAVPVQVNVDFGELPAAAGAIEVEYIGADGDVVRRRETVPILPGTTVSRWMLVSPPTPTTPMTATLLDSNGRMLMTSAPRTAASLATPVPAGDTTIVIVGTDRGGFQLLTPDALDAVTTTPMTTATIMAQDLPHALAAFHGIDTIVWSDGGIPAPETAAAVLDWVHSGGHLVLFPPAMGAPWGEGSGDLSRGVGLEETPQPRSVSGTTLRAFFDGGATGSELDLPMLIDTQPWMSIRTDQSDAPIITRRALGFGHVTAVAIDPSRRALAALRSREGGPARPNLASLWGAALARRDLPIISQLEAAINDDRFRGRPMSTTDWLTDSLPAHWLHRTTTVSGRLLLAAGLAGIYFIVAGPLLWRVLGRRGQRELLWPALGVCAATFAVLVWVVGSIVMPSSVHVQHMTVLDHVSGSAQYRVQSWMDLQLPGSGNRLISTPAAVGDNDPSHTALIRTWQPASAASITFGDVRRLPTATDDGELVTAARDATTRLHLHWRGMVNPERWGRMFASSPDAPIGIDEDHALHGVLVNRLDVPVRDMSIIWIQGPASNVGAGGAWIDPTTAGTPLVRGQWWSPVNGELLPGESIDLTLIEPSPASDLASTLHKRQLAFSTIGLLIQSDSKAQHAMELLSLWSLATPPPWAIPPPPPGIENPIARRERELAPKWAMPKRAFGADLDLGPWLASPALIVLGWIESSDVPVPLHIDGQAADEQDGLILIRWVLPLDDVSDTGNEPT